MFFDQSVCRGITFPGPDSLLPVKSSQMNIKGLIYREGPIEPGGGGGGGGDGDVPASPIKKAYKFWDICKYGLYFDGDAPELPTLVNRQDPQNGRTGLVI